MTTVTTPNIADLISKLQGHLTTLGERLAAKTLSEQAVYWRTSDTIQRTISALKNTSGDLDKSLARLADREEHRAAVVERFALLEKELADAPEWRMVPNAHARDREYDRQRTLRLQLQMLHDGTLLIAPGVVAGRLTEIDARIAELQQKIAMLRARLAEHVQQAEVLLGATATT